MMNTLNLRRVGGLFLMLLLTICPTMAQYTSTEDGILVTVADKQVEVSVANACAFRLSLGSTTPGRISSVFLDQAVTSDFTVVAEAPSYGIQTSFGKLLVNTTTRKFSLYDETGQELVSNASLISSATTQSYSLPNATTNRLYGAGNFTTKELVKKSTASSVGNGTSDIPYFWNSAGYCALGISTDDNVPAKWSTTTSSINWSFKGTLANLYIWPAKTLYDASNAYVKLTGRPKLPPKWAFGYLQSKWGWDDRAFIENTLNTFRSRKHPVDGFIYDFEWYTSVPDYFLNKDGMNGFSDFSFYNKLFNEPAKQIAAYKAKGVKFIGIRKPRLGNAANLTLARSKGWLKYPSTDSRDLDFSNDSLRIWYGNQTKPLLAAGADAWWNDEGESYYTCYYWWNRAQYDLRNEARPNDRHFTLNRAFSPGNQRMGYCTWNGDIKSSWQAFFDTPADLLNWSLSGMYYGTCDIGGFGDQVEPTPECLVRWYQAGVFFPVMRAHSNVGKTSHFPWLWGAAQEVAIRKALNLRYRLIPYIYSLAHEAYQTGAPIMRPLLMEYPNDSTVFNTTDEWLLGKGLLAAPLVTEGNSRKIYLPNDLWYDFATNLAIQGPTDLSVTKNLDEIPVYVRAGTILPLGPVVQYTEQDTITPLEIRIYPGRDGRFVLREDDGKSYNYLSDSVRTTTYVWDDATNTLSWVVSGIFTDKKVFKTIKVVLDNQVQTATINTQGLLTFEDLKQVSFYPTPGRYDTPQDIVLTAEGGDIYYTLDGSNPTRTSTKYSQPISLSSGTMTTIKSLVSVNGNDSPIYSGNYIINGDCTSEGRIAMEKWTGLDNSVAVSSIPLSKTPNSTTYLTTSMQVPVNTSQSNYGVRIRGLLSAPMTGEYTFYVCGDDYVELWLSTDSLAANKVKIAYHNNWTNLGEWYKYPEQKSRTITLNGCQKYYIEALLKQSGGGDNLAVRWVTPDYRDEIIPCKFLSTLDYANGLSAADAIDSVKLYPNPSKSKVTLDLGDAVTGKTKLTVYDVLGKALFQYEMQSRTMDLNVSGWHPGTYFFDILNAGKKSTLKFVVNR